MKKKLLILVVVLLCIVACVAMAFWLFASEEWDGRMVWTFRVTVLDAGTRKPVSTATSRIVVANETSFGQIESFIEPDTMPFPANPSGICLITSPFPCYGHKSRFKSTAFMNFRHRNIRVDAPGYQRFERPLKTLVITPLEFNSQPCTTNVEVVLTHTTPGFPPSP